MISGVSLGVGINFIMPLYKGICIVTTQAVTSASDGFTLNSLANIFHELDRPVLANTGWRQSARRRRRSQPIRLVADSGAEPGHRCLSQSAFSKTGLQPLKLRHREPQQCCSKPITTLSAI